MAANQAIVAVDTRAACAKKALGLVNGFVLFYYLYCRKSEAVEQKAGRGNNLE